MYSDFSATITRRPDFYFVAVPIWIGLGVTFFLLDMLLSPVIPQRSPIMQPVYAVLVLGSLFGVGYITGVAPQGRIEIRGHELRTHMRFRQDRVFDLRTTQITLEQWIGPGAVRGGPMGPMLVFDQGPQHFRIGCYDYEGARLLTPVKVGAWFAREAHGATKCRDFYALADRLGVHIPRPQGWQSQENGSPSPGRRR